MKFEKMLQDEVQNLMFNILDIANEDSMSVWDKDSYHINLQLFLRTIARACHQLSQTTQETK